MSISLLWGIITVAESRSLIMTGRRKGFVIIYIMPHTFRSPSSNLWRSDSEALKIPDMEPLFRPYKKFVFF